MKLKLAFFSFLLITFFSCDKDESGSNPNASDPTITVRLVDAPGDYKAVNVEVVDVMIKMDDESDDENGWISLEAEKETINLLDFTGGVSKVLVEDFPIPVGTLTQMRLVLGDGNTILIENDQEEDEEFDLKTPSAQQSGLKLKTNSVIEQGFTYDFVLDFDVEKSIVMAGDSDNIILKPVIYMSAEVNSGIIEGTVTPSDVPSIASVLVDDMGTPETEDDFVISAATDETGAFALWGVPAGTYEVIVTPQDETSDYDYGSAEGVVVTNGEITTISDPIELMLKPGSISGDVTNENLVVSVTLKDKDTEEEIASMDSNEDGEFLFEDVAPGVYIVTIEAETFVSQDIEVTVEPGLETAMDDVTLVAE
ncbi:DUF4382 domain-containing protein [Flavobacteriaceae bacterium XHP0103]|uniref:DUF4382 domain-containing protein n=1 Tax=Marixanthotalea marina TaxID=2844359 RepID=UPI00298A0621|nr:DUF4382 domain-containing protein [Marixanthotalea marina]MBU3820492.1 DUF4382 domain-containing protein [Marixanthotalea marina]